MTRPTPAARRSTTRATAGLELPDCFATATAASEARLLSKPVAARTRADVRDLRRLASKARALEVA